MRVLVTGSRNYDDPALVRRALQQVAERIGDAPEPVGNGYSARRLAHNIPITLVIQGAIPTGAGAAAPSRAEDINILHGRERIGVERHPADWNRECDELCSHGPIKAGRKCPDARAARNRAMVATGGDVCLAFPMRGSEGLGTAQLARDAGIFTIIYRRPDADPTAPRPARATRKGAVR